MKIDKRWLAVDEVPPQYTKRIEHGNLKNKSDISPQWRIKAMTEVYGLQGIGWKWEEVERSIYACPEGQVMCFIRGNLYIKDGNSGEWSEPIEGNGGNFIVNKNKNGLVPNDEGWKMATSDAMGTAMKGIGVASKVYEGSFDGSKYQNKGDATKEPPRLITPEERLDLIRSYDDWSVDAYEAAINGSICSRDSGEIPAISEWLKTNLENRIENTKATLKGLLKERMEIDEGFKGQHIASSLKKHLGGVERVDQCNNIDLLRAYLEHTNNKIKENEAGVDFTQTIQEQTEPVQPIETTKTLND